MFVKENRMLKMATFVPPYEGNIFLACLRAPLEEQKNVISIYPKCEKVAVTKLNASHLGPLSTKRRFDIPGM